MTLPDEKYSSSDYLDANPTWDSEDSPWKAKKVSDFIHKLHVPSLNICEIGCGAGGILAELRKKHSDAVLTGFDIAPLLNKFWKMHDGFNINFILGDFLNDSFQNYETILLLDVIEHLRDPFYFLNKIKSRGSHFIFHMPLDLSSVNVLREKPLLNVRKKVGHIHYFTKNLFLSLLSESGFEVVGWEYTKAYLSGPGHSLKTMLASIPRSIAFFFNKDMGVRILGGETLLVYAKPRRE